MNRLFTRNLLMNLNQVKVFSLQLVDGHCIIPYDIYFVTASPDNTYIRAVAYPDTDRQHSLLIDKADIIEDLSNGNSSGTTWIELELGEPTELACALGAAIEKQCAQRGEIQA